VSMASDGAVPLVVCHDENDVRPGTRELGRSARDGKDQCAKGKKDAFHILCLSGSFI
jgi:hypothetical protein